MPQPFRPQTVLAFLLATIACLLLSACRNWRQQEPTIVFTQVPPVGEGTQDVLETIQGIVTGARPGQRIVLFSRSGKWWVQPFATHPFTEIQPDSTWKSSIHPGFSYAALLVDSRYRPSSTMTLFAPEGRPGPSGCHGARRSSASLKNASVQRIPVENTRKLDRSPGIGELL